MIVGRAVNGWSETWEHGFFVQESPFKMVSEAYQRSLVKPLTWVNYFWGRNEKDEKGNKCYNTAVSRFWQLAKELIYRLTPQEQLVEKRWAETIVWSNLYKVAPNEGGNPNEPLCRAQLEYCRNILKHEIEITTPQYWDNPFWTNKQHVAMELSRLGYRILYIDRTNIQWLSLPAHQLNV